MNPRWADKFPVPLWFFDIYDAIIMNKPVHNADSIQRVPLYLRRRYRTVWEILKEAKVEMANKNKAMPVFDWSNFY